MKEQECIQLNCHDARFGLAMTSVGDIDRDGYQGNEWVRWLNLIGRKPYSVFDWKDCEVNMPQCADDDGKYDLVASLTFVRSHKALGVVTMIISAVVALLGDSSGTV